MSSYDEKIYQDALKAAQHELGDQAEAVAKEFATAYAQVKNLKQAPTDDQKLQVCALFLISQFLSRCFTGEGVLFPLTVLSAGLNRIRRMRSNEHLGVLFAGVVPIG